MTERTRFDHLTELFSIFAAALSPTHLLEGQPRYAEQLRRSEPRSKANLRRGEGLVGILPGLRDIEGRTEQERTPIIEASQRNLIQECVSR
jgi:hypothetical protein